jgi:hypothetical protein
MSKSFPFKLAAGVLNALLEVKKNGGFASCLQTALQ